MAKYKIILAKRYGILSHELVDPLGVVVLKFGDWRLKDIRKLVRLANKALKESKT